jgi:methionyl-tRNA formyltransferase
VVVVAAFGQILKPDVLELPVFGCINVHASLLPRWRGAAPIQAAILSNDQYTGITIMCMDPGVDTGPILSQRSIPIHPTDTAGRLSQRLAQTGAELLVETLPGYLTNEIIPQDQDDSEVIYAPMLKKKDGELDFTKSANDLARQVRAYNPWPGTYTIWHNKILKIHMANSYPEDENQGGRINPGQRTQVRDYPVIITKDGLLVLETVQPAGKRIMSGKEFLLGAKDWLE